MYMYPPHTHTYVHIYIYICKLDHSLGLNLGGCLPPLPKKKFFLTHIQVLIITPKCGVAYLVLVAEEILST